MAQGTERIIRLLRPSVVVLCGPAGCGKTAFSARHFRPTQVISSDVCRALVCDDERDQRYHEQAFALVNFIVGQRLSINRLCIVDSTALARAARKTLLDLARRHRVRCSLFLFDIPIETCLEHDQLRERQVGPKVIEEHFLLFSQMRPTIESEGFDEVLELHEEDLQNVRFEIIYRPVSPARSENPSRKSSIFP